MRRKFEPKRDEVTREWRKLLNEELNALYCSPIIFHVIKSRRMRWAGHVARIGERRGVPLGRPRRRWEDNIKMGLQEVGSSWLDRDRWRALVNAVMNLRVI